MTNNEKTFEQGVAVGMLLSKGVDQGSKTYNLKDQLFKYILENGKIIGTCKVGNNCLKEYIGLVHYSDPNAKLFWNLNRSLRTTEINMSRYSREKDLTMIDDPIPFVQSIAPYIMNGEGVIHYTTNIFFSEDDEPLFGSVSFDWNYSNFGYAYIYNSPLTMEYGAKAVVCWPSRFYSGLEEAIESVEYTGDIESYMYADTITISGKTRVRVTTKYKDSSGADVSGDGFLNVVYKKSSTSMTWRKTTVQLSDGSIVTIDDTTKPPIVTKMDPEDDTVRIHYYYEIFPNPMMVADNVTDKDIANAVANAYDVLYKNAEGPAANKLLGVELSTLLTPQ